MNLWIFALVFVHLLNQHGWKLCPLPVFSPCPGEPLKPFDMWMQIFNNYLLVISGNSWPGAQQGAQQGASLLHRLQRDSSFSTRYRKQVTTLPLLLLL